MESLILIMHCKFFHCFLSLFVVVIIIIIIIIINQWTKVSNTSSRFQGLKIMESYKKVTLSRVEGSTN